jgi:hypothetical protein
MRSRNKLFIKTILLGLLFLNLIMACIVLIPVETAYGATLNNRPAVNPEQPLTTIQQIQRLDQVMRNFWVSLLPFWDE